MNNHPPRPSGAHTHPPNGRSVAVDQSQEVSDQLRPIVQELNRLIDRLEHLAGHDADSEEPE